MIKKYKVKTHRGFNAEVSIQEVEVEKESFTFIWVGNNRIAKKSLWENYLDTWEQAYTFLISHQRNIYKQKLREAREAKKRLEEIKLLKKVTRHEN